LIPFHRLSIGGFEFVMLARSLLRVPNRAIARQSLGKSTVRSHQPDQPIDLGQQGQSIRNALFESERLD
jgi:hypothetical protein